MRSYKEGFSINYTFYTSFIQMQKMINILYCLEFSHGELLSLMTILCHSNHDH